jgi:oligopeptide transport system ATP-binding protein
MPSDERTPGPLLEVKNLSKDFPIRSPFTRRVVGRVEAVRNVSFRLDRGRTLGLVGESGSGKTTIGRMITRFVEPSSGVIEFDGADLTRLRGRALQTTRRSIQMIFQNPYQSLNPQMTVREIVTEPIIAHTRQRHDAPAVTERVDQLLTSVGLQSYHHRHPHQLSGGQRQRVAIARALSVDPQLLVCDEPTSALDVSIRAEVVNLLVRLQKEFHFAYVFISHDLGVVHHVSDDIVVLCRGEIVEQGPASEIYNSPQHDYTKLLLSSMLTPGSRLARGERPAKEGTR